MLTNSERSQLGRLAAHESWANTPNRAARTANARAALDQKFFDAADGDPVRAAHLRKAHFARLALKSAVARRKARELTETAETADAEIAEVGGQLSCGEPLADIEAYPRATFKADPTGATAVRNVERGGQHAC